jgi:hypothetical protein
MVFQPLFRPNTHLVPDGNGGYYVEPTYQLDFSDIDPDVERVFWWLLGLVVILCLIYMFTRTRTFYQFKLRYLKWQRERREARLEKARKRPFQPVFRVGEKVELVGVPDMITLGLMGDGYRDGKIVTPRATHGKIAEVSKTPNTYWVTWEDGTNTQVTGDRLRRGLFA